MKTNWLNRYVIPVLIFLLAFSPVAQAHKENLYRRARPLTPFQAAMIDRAIDREHVLIREIQRRTPVVETYIQNTMPDEKLLTVPVSDKYFISRIGFRKGFFNHAYSLRPQHKNGVVGESLAAIARLTGALRLSENFDYDSRGFTEMMFLDPAEFDTRHYAFGFVRREFLGTVLCSVFDVHPKVTGAGRFLGRIWIEESGSNIVRLNGTFTRSRFEDDSRLYFHFETWRDYVPTRGRSADEVENQGGPAAEKGTQGGYWLPVAVYVEEFQRVPNVPKLGMRAQTRFWGYSDDLSSQSSGIGTIKIPEDPKGVATDVDPSESHLKWIDEAQDNLIDRLEDAGLVAPLPGVDSQGNLRSAYEIKILDQIVVNLSIPSNLAFAEPVHCRVLLTSTIEATTVGNTILLSKGLLDTTPTEEAIASVVALELAHVAMGHHVDTRYAFNDRLLFPDEDSFRIIEMNHTDREITEAEKRAMEYLRASMYADKLPSAGLYWAQLADRGKALRALNKPRLGDSLLKADGTPWMTDLARLAQKIDWDDSKQIPAYPLESWLKTDPFDDSVSMLNSTRYAPMNARDKMPFEVAPIFYRLQPPGGVTSNASPSILAPGSQVDSVNAEAPASVTTPSDQTSAKTGSSQPSPKGVEHPK